MTAAQLTPFQVRCQKEVQELFRTSGIGFTCRKVDGEGESYIVLDAHRASAKRLQIYIYEDEAGYFEGDDWHIWETPDYNESELIGSIVGRVRSLL